MGAIGGLLVLIVGAMTGLLGLGMLVLALLALYVSHHGSIGALQQGSTGVLLMAAAGAAFIAVGAFCCGHGFRSLKRREGT